MTLCDAVIVSRTRRSPFTLIGFFVIGMNCDKQNFQQSVLVEGFLLMGGGWLEEVSRRDVRGSVGKPFSRLAGGVGGWGIGRGCVYAARISSPPLCEGWGFGEVSTAPPKTPTKSSLFALPYTVKPKESIASTDSSTTQAKQKEINNFAPWPNYPSFPWRK